MTGEGIILLPTKGKPENLKRYIDHHARMHGSLRHVIIIETLDRSYDDIAFPADWLLRSYDGGRGAATHFNAVFEEFPNEAFYGYVADDCIPQTPEWDVRLSDACMLHGFAWPRDKRQDNRFAAHAFVRGDLVRAQGCLNPLGFHHYGFDNYWFHLARAAGKAVYLGDVVLEHAREDYQEGDLEAQRKWRRFRHGSGFKEALCKIAA